MSMRQQARALLAVAAAYVIALPAILLAFGGPIASLGATAAPPICSALGLSHPAPAGHAGGCLGACLGCYCAPTGCPAPANPLSYVPAAANRPAVARITAPLFVAGAANAHRSRAPPPA